MGTDIPGEVIARHGKPSRCTKKMAARSGQVGKASETWAARSGCLLISAAPRGLARPRHFLAIARLPLMPHLCCASPCLVELLASARLLNDSCR
jgi:hypothetical protein